MSHAICIGISSCLLGQRVRYDGADKKNEFVTASLGAVFELIPFCPEVAIGMGVPRAPIQLVQAGTALRARGVSDPGVDVTGRLRDYARQVLPLLRGLSGYVLKGRSPTCGLGSVEVHGPAGLLRSDGNGIFAQQLVQLVPGLPVVEAEDLVDKVSLDAFVERVFAYHGRGKD